MNELLRFEIWSFVFDPANLRVHFRTNYKLLSGWTGLSSLAKLGIVALKSVLLSYGISRYILKPSPRFVVIGLVGLSILLTVAR